LPLFPVLILWFTALVHICVSPGGPSGTPGFTQWLNIRAAAEVHGVRQGALVYHLAFTADAVLSLKVSTATVR